MCVIFCGTRESILSLSLDRAWQANSDGAGILVPSKQAPHIIKGIMRLGDLRHEIKQQRRESILCVHLRLATHGAPNGKNTHPFRVDRDTWLMHNGILSALGKSGNDGHSDSQHLANILSKLEHKDRVPLLRSLSGRFVLVHKAQVITIGDFQERHNVLMSNTYWDFTVADSVAKYTNHGWPWTKRTEAVSDSLKIDLNGVAHDE